MAECQNGHAVPAGQDFCGKCGTSMPTGEQARTEFNEGTPDVEGGGDLDGENQPGPSSGAGLAEHLWAPERRPYTLVVGLLLVLALAAVVGIAASSGSDSPDDQAAPEEPSEEPEQEAQVEPESPQDACFTDLNSILVASSQGVTANEAILAIGQVYGSNDRRSQFMVSNYTRYLGEVNSLGTTTANGAAVERVVTWCADNATDFDY